MPPGTLVTATPDGNEWEYIYADVTSDEARAFAEEITGMGFDVKVTVDSDGVEQWYMQSADWAIKLEETHADESLMYWVDAIIESVRRAAIRFTTLDGFCEALHCQPGDIHTWVPDAERG